MLSKFIGTEIGMAIGLFKLLLSGQFKAFFKTSYVYFMATLQMLWLLTKTFFTDLASVVFHPVQTVERVNHAITSLIIQGYAEVVHREHKKEELGKPREINWLWDELLAESANKRSWLFPI